MNLDRSLLETAAINDIGLIINNGLKERGNVPRVVFKIGILNEDDVPGCFLNSADYGGTLASVLVLGQKTVGILIGQFF